MGQTKRLMEDQGELRAMAVGVLCAVGTLEQCEFHDGYYFDGHGDLEQAYRAANARVSAGELELPDGMSRRDLTDQIKRAYEELSFNDECARCHKIMNDD